MTDRPSNDPIHLVVGASGALGSRVARRLLAAGARVRVASRDPARLQPLTALGAESVRLDLLEPNGHAGLLEGIDRVVLASHGLVPPSRRNTPAAVDGDGARRLIDAAAAEGVRRVVFVSIAGAEREATVFARVKRATERHLQRAGALVEQAVGATAKRQHLPVPVVRLVRGATTSLHPGVHALLDLALDEIARGGDPADEAECADAMGPTRVADVVAAWARDGVGDGVAGQS